jgi:hypothetical protein
LSLNPSYAERFFKAHSLNPAAPKGDLMKSFPTRLAPVFCVLAISLCYFLYSPSAFSQTLPKEQSGPRPCDSDAPDAKDVNVQVAYRIVKGTGEDLVTRIAAKYKPTDPEYKEAEQLYRAAQIRFNAYLDASLLQMVQKQKGNLTPSAHEACRAGNAFTTYVVEHTEVRSFLAFLPIAKTLIDYAIGFYDKHKEKEQAKRKAIADALRPQIMWKSWSDIVKENP